MHTDDTIKRAAELAVRYNCAIEISVGPYGTARVRATRDGTMADVGAALGAVGDALEAIARKLAGPSPAITYPEQKPPPSHPVQFARGTAQAVAGLAFPAADDDEPIRIGEIVAASDPGIVHVTIDVSKTLANVTETQDGRFVLWMAIPREAWPGKI